MRDLLPEEVEVRDAAIARILDVYVAYGFRRIETPALEHLELLAASEGGENEKLIFKVLKRGEVLADARAAGSGELADLGLRFDLTVPLARYYANNQARLPKPLKAIQVGPVWRAERPQKGRFRQFTQCDIDILGVGSEIAEVELILATCEALLALGLERPSVRINDRRILGAIARFCGVDEARHTSFFIAFDKLDKVGKAGVLEELGRLGLEAGIVSRFGDLLDELCSASGLTLERLRDLVPAVAGERHAWEQLARIVDVVAGEAADRFTIAFDPTLVRGMGYYTGPIFEVSYAGYGASIAGGGRYDRMVGKLLGQDVPACGFSIGFERIVAILMERRAGGSQPAEAATSRRVRIALLVEESVQALPAVLRQARALREAGNIVSLEVKRRNLRHQLDELARHGVSAYGLAEPGTAPSVLKPLRAGESGRGGMVD